MDKDWQAVHSIDAPQLTCEVVQVINASLLRNRYWIGSETLRAKVITHTLICGECARQLVAWMEDGVGIEKMMDILSIAIVKKGETLDEFLKNRYVMGSGRAANIPCEVVQACHLRVFLTKEPPEDRDFEATVIAHTLICRACGQYLDDLVHGRIELDEEETGDLV
jgi:hypothetical protein